MIFVIAALAAALVFAIGYALYALLARRGQEEIEGGLRGRILQAGGGAALAEDSEVVVPKPRKTSGRPDKAPVDPAFEQLIGSITQLVRRFSGLPLFSNLLFTPANIRRMDRRLSWAGRPFGLDGEQWISVNIFLVSATFVYGLFNFLSSGVPAWEMLLLLSGVVAAPSLWLSSRIKARHLRLERELPTLINKLILASMSKMDMLSTIDVVIRFTRGELTDELRTALHETRVHRERGVREIFTDMAERCGNQNVTAFCNTIINSITQNSQAADLLRGQEEAMKEITKANNEAIINRTETYLMFSASLGIICVLVMVAGPSFVSIMQGISSVGGG